MKRRDFLKKASLAGVSLPFAAWALFRGHELSADDIPALKKLISTPKHPDFCIPEGIDPATRAFGQVYNDSAGMEEICRKLKAHFAKHEWWMESTEYDGEWRGPCKVNKFQFGEHTCSFHGLVSIMCLDHGVHVEMDNASEWVYIFQKSGSGRELNWYWRPATPFEINGGPEYTVMGVDQICPHPKRGNNDILYYRVEGPHFCTTGTSDDWKYLDILMSRYQVKMCVIDRYPEAHLAQKFADRYPGFVKIAKHVRDSRYRLLVTDTAPDTVQIRCNDFWPNAHPISAYNLSPAVEAQEYAKKYCEVARQLIAGDYVYRRRGFDRQVCEYMSQRLMDHQEKMIMKGASMGFTESVLGSINAWR